MSTPNERDKVTVGLTPSGWTNLEALMETGWFADQVDAYRSAIAVALARALPLQEMGLSGVTTKFNRGTLDKDGSVRTLISALLPAARTRPYEYAELLADAGIRYLKEALVDQHLLLAEVLGQTAAE